MRRAFVGGVTLLMFLLAQWVHCAVLFGVVEKNDTRLALLASPLLFFLAIAGALMTVESYRILRRTWIETETE